MQRLFALLTLSLIVTTASCGGAEDEQVTQGLVQTEVVRALEATSLAEPTPTATREPTAAPTEKPQNTPTPRPQFYSIEYVMIVTESRTWANSFGSNTRIDVEYMDASGSIEEGYLDFGELDKLSGKVISTQLATGDRAYLSMSGLGDEMTCQIIANGDVVVEKSGTSHVECVATVGD